MNEIKIILYNVKKWEGEHEMMFLSPMNAIKGQNESGKSTVIQSIESIFTGNGMVKVTDGKDHGYVVYSGKDLNGNEIKIQMDVYDDKKESFMINYFHKESGKWKTVKDKKIIQELLGLYYPLSAHEVFYMVKTVDGRRRLIDDYLLKTLSDDKRVQLEHLKDCISSSKNKRTYNIQDLENFFENYIPSLRRGKHVGLNIYHQRAELNVEIKACDSLIDSQKLTEKEGESVKNSKDILKRIEDINKILEEANDDSVLLNNLQNDIVNLRSNGNEVLASFDNLSLKVINVLNEEEGQTYKDAIIDLKSQFQESLNSNGKGLKLQIEELEKTLGSLDDFKEEKRKLNEKTSSIPFIVKKQEVFNIQTNKREELIKEKKTLEKAIETIKGSIGTIFKESKLPDCLSITEDGDVILNGFVIDENVNSESEMWMAIIELLCILSENQVIKIGDWTVFDSKSKKKIADIAEKHDKMFIGQYVDDSIESPAVVNLIIDEDRAKAPTKKVSPPEGRKLSETPKASSGQLEF